MAHSWTYKTTEIGFQIVCRDCGASDKAFHTIEATLDRIRALREQKSPKDPYGKWGFGRKARKSRAAKRKLVQIEAK